MILYRVTYFIIISFYYYFEKLWFIRFVSKNRLLPRFFRYHKCLSCYEKLSAIRAILMKKSTSGKLGASFRELAVLIRSLEWPKTRHLRPSWIRPSMSPSVDNRRFSYDNEVHQERTERSLSRWCETNFIEKQQRECSPLSHIEKSLVKSFLAAFFVRCRWSITLLFLLLVIVICVTASISETNK